MKTSLPSLLSKDAAAQGLLDVIDLLAGRMSTAKFLALELAKIIVVRTQDGPPPELKQELFWRCMMAVTVLDGKDERKLVPGREAACKVFYAACHQNLTWPSRSGGGQVLKGLAKQMAVNARNHVVLHLKTGLISYCYARAVEELVEMYQEGGEEQPAEEEEEPAMEPSEEEEEEEEEPAEEEEEPAEEDEEPAEEEDQPAEEEEEPALPAFVIPGWLTNAGLRTIAMSMASAILWDRPWVAGAWARKKLSDAQIQALWHIVEHERETRRSQGLLEDTGYKVRASPHLYLPWLLEIIDALNTFNSQVKVQSQIWRQAGDEAQAKKWDGFWRTNFGPLQSASLTTGFIPFDFYAANVSSARGGGGATLHTLKRAPPRNCTVEIERKRLLTLDGLERAWC